MTGYLPANLVAIRLRCARCGAITTTPGLVPTEILPRTAVPIEPIGQPMPTTAGLRPGDVLVCARTLASEYAGNRPLPWPDEPVAVTQALLEDAARGYDRLAGGRLAAQIEASPAADDAEHGPYPFAWSVARLRTKIGTPGWSWLNQDDDAMATMHVVALRHLMRCWGQHPLLPRLTAALAEPDGLIRTLVTLGTAKLLYDAGNRVGFTLADAEPGLHFSTSAGDPLTLALLEPEALKWRQRDRRTPASLRAAVIEAVNGVQSRVNRTRPGIVVLASSILQPDFDQMLVDAIHAAFDVAGRRNRGVAAVAVVMPKVLQAGHPDWVGFGYAFYPILNPRFMGQNPIRLHAA
ncbi:MAG: hypothetical protein WDN25_16095 [Acetobacteraceae bacterium]